MEDIIMKKRYIEPQAVVVAIGTCQIICTSTLGNGGKASEHGVTSADSPDFDFDDFDDD